MFVFANTEVLTPPAGLILVPFPYLSRDIILHLLRICLVHSNFHHPKTITQMAAVGTPTQDIPRLSQPPQPLPRIPSTEDIIPLTKTALNELRAVWDWVAQNISPSSATLEDAVQPLIDVENLTQGALGVVSMLRYASPDPAGRAASEEAVGLISACASELTVRDDLYRIISAVKDRREGLGSEASKYLDILLTDFTRCGHGRLDVGQVKQYLDRRNEIDALRRDFKRNIRECDDGIWLSPEELDGVPQAELDRFRIGKDGPNEGMLFIRTQSADPDMIVRHATSPRTRRRVYLAEMGGLEKNVDLLKDVILKRDENARLLGYSSHAAFRLERRVAKTVARVEEFLDDVESNLLELGAAEMALLLERKALYVQANPDLQEPYPDCMPPWDYPFYSHLVQEEMNIRHEQIAEYYPLRNTLMSMLEVFASCLQLQFVPLATESLADSTWHDDVEAWSVWDCREKTRGEFVGYLYADVLQRPGKHKGSQNVNLQCVSSMQIIQTCPYR